MSLPKQLYVYEETDDDESWFTAYEDVEDVAEKSEDREVGIYELKKVIRVSLETKVSEV